MASGLFTLKQQVQALRQGAWSGQKPQAVEYLVVAGGGGGGATYSSGGGGGGGLLTGILPVSTGSSITATVGGGGAASTIGQNSVFGSITAIGGGKGGNGQSGNPGGDGGSGGGGGSQGSATSAGGQSTGNQGNTGGRGAVGPGVYGAGGGGGAGTIGLTGTSATPGAGGAGIASAINGTVTAYAGGGGAGSYFAGGGFDIAGGVGGGGTGKYNANGVAGTANTGGGGGGTGLNSGTGAAGGSGIVVISYPDTYAAATSSTGSPTVSTSGSGSIAFNGSSQYLNYAAQTPFSMNTGDFTVEFWSYATGGLSNYPSYVDFRGSSVSSPTFFIYNDYGSLVFGTRISGTNANTITHSFSTLNTWFHIAAVRISGVTKLYVNGTQVGSSYTDSNSYTVGTGAPYIGQNGQGGGYFTGYMSNIRIVKGVGVYTGTFTPSTAPLQATQPAGTNIAAITGTQTSLLLNAVSGGLTADSSTNGYTPAPVSTVSPTWNSASPFATGLGYKNRVYTWTSSGSITF